MTDTANPSNAHVRSDAPGPTLQTEILQLTDIGGTASWAQTIHPWLAPQDQQVFLMQQEGPDLQLHLMAQDTSGRVNDAGLGPVVVVVGVSLTDLAGPA